MTGLSAYAITLHDAMKNAQAKAIDKAHSELQDTEERLQDMIDDGVSSTNTDFTDLLDEYESLEHTLEELSDRYFFG